MDRHIHSPAAVGRLEETQRSVFSQNADESIKTAVQRASTPTGASAVESINTAVQRAPTPTDALADESIKTAHQLLSVMPSIKDQIKAPPSKESPEAADDNRTEIKFDQPAFHVGSSQRKKDLGPLHSLPPGITWTDDQHRQGAISFSSWANELWTSQQIIAILISARWLHKSHPSNASEYTNPFSQFIGLTWNGRDNTEEEAARNVIIPLTIEGIDTESIVQRLRTDHFLVEESENNEKIQVKTAGDSTDHTSSDNNDDSKVAALASKDTDNDPKAAAAKSKDKDNDLEDAAVESKDADNTGQRIVTGKRMVKF